MLRSLGCRAETLTDTGPDPYPPTVHRASVVHADAADADALVRANRWINAARVLLMCEPAGPVDASNRMR